MTSVPNYPTVHPASPEPWLSSRSIEDVARDPSLSWDARGLYAYLVLCHPVGLVPPAFAQVVADTADGPFTTRRALEELRAAGLIVGHLP